MREWFARPRIDHSLTVAARFGVTLSIHALTTELAEKTTIADAKSGLHFIEFLTALVRSYAGRKIRLVCDNARYHHTRAVQDWLDGHRRWIEVYWLQPYCPDLNLIERLWGHLKRTVIANVLFSTFDDLVTAFRRGVQAVNAKRNKMGFMFDHDDVSGKIAA